MSVNSFTLNNLYNQGIIDYVPFELCNGANVALMGGMQNPYLNSAMQGELYKNHGQYGDRVEIGGVNGGKRSSDGIIGSESVAGGTSAFGLNGIGSQSNAGTNAFGLDGVGSQSNAGINAYGIEGIGSQSTAGGADAWGGFGDVNNGINKTMSKIEQTPNFVKGLVAGALMIGAVAVSLKRGKKPQAEKQSFFAKLNPFKKKN